jgi:periplasmic protein TonB
MPYFKNNSCSRAVTVLAMAAFIASGCASRRAPQQSEPAPPVTPSAPASAPATANSSATTVDHYKRELAARIYQTSAAQVFEGSPPNLLRSVIVLSVTLDSSGNVADLRTMRDNGDSETVRAAHDSVRRGAPYPRPPDRLLRSARLQYVETWLFRDDGKFQLRTVAEAWQQ